MSPRSMFSTRRLAQRPPKVCISTPQGPRFATWPPDTMQQLVVWDGVNAIGESFAFSESLNLRRTAAPAPTYQGAVFTRGNRIDVIFRTFPPTNRYDVIFELNLFSVRRATAVATRNEPPLNLPFATVLYPMTITVGTGNAYGQSLAAL